MRVLLDSNVWLAILTTDGFCRQLWRKFRDHSRFCASPNIFAEVEEKLHTKFGFALRHARLMTLFVQRQTEVVEVASVITVCRDPDDNQILAAAVDAKCSHLVTGDSDLLELKEFQDVRIVAPRQFVEAFPEK